MPENHNRIVIVDNDPIVRAAVAQMLARRGAAEIVATLGSGHEAIDYCETHRVDAVLMDARMPGLDGISASADLKTHHPGLRVVIFSSYDSPPFTPHDGPAGASHAERAKADAFVSKSATIDEVEQALLGESCASSARNTLTGREHEVLNLLCTGMTNRQISRALGISETTVKTHISSVMHKTGSQSRTQVLLWAARRGAGPND